MSGSAIAIIRRVWEVECSACGPLLLGYERSKAEALRVFKQHEQTAHGAEVAR